MPAHSHQKLRLLTALIATLLILSACAPAANNQPAIPRVTGSLSPDAPSFYPHQTGLTWTYLEEGDTILTPEYTHAILGPSILEGERVVLERMRGRTLDTTYFRQYANNGVFLHREERPGATITYDPPLQEFPAPGQLRPGATWGGTTTATVTYEKTGTPNINELEYTFMVLEQRDATVPAGTFPVYTIEFTATQAGETNRQQLWFTPYYGTIRTRGELLLTGGNILDARRE